MPNRVEDPHLALRQRLGRLSAARRRVLARALGSADESHARQLVAYLAVSGEVPDLERLAAELTGRLPDYMIPSRYVVVDRLPRTEAGKLDRRALQSHEGAELTPPASDVVQARTDHEILLVEIWKDVLGTDEISVHDDFFEIGGDSLLSIRVIARAGRAGLEIRPDAFFDHPTIAQLASQLDEQSSAADTVHVASQVRDAAESEQGPVTGAAPLTPIQHWFFERITTGFDYWNQSRLVEIPEQLDQDRLDRVVTSLVAHHDALRLRFVRGETRDGGAGAGGGDGSWRQELDPLPEQPPLRMVDLTGCPAEELTQRIDAECSVEHASLELEEGGLFRTVLFEGPPGRRRLAVIAHHLLVDGVSWAILLEDLSTLVEQALADRPLELPGKTRSVREWAHRLVEAAGAPGVQAMEAHWVTCPPGIACQVPEDITDSPDGDRVADAAIRKVEMAPQDTVRLEQAARKLDATLHHLLLAALLLAWRSWTGRETLQLDMEGHGRDVLGNAPDSIDVSRSVGWFTTVFPVWLTLSAPTATAAVQAVRAALSELPLRGASHGLLRFLSRDEKVRSALAGRSRSEILFNYLGRTDALLPPGSPLRMAAESSGRMRASDAPRAYPIEVNARIESGRLLLEIEYSSRRHRAQTIDRFADALTGMLHEVGAATPTPFALSGLDETGLAQVADLLSETDDE